MFQLQSDSQAKPQYSPPAVSSNGLFSVQSTPQANRFPESPTGHSLFAGATPAAKSVSSKLGSRGGGLFSGSSGKPVFSFNPPGNGASKQPTFSPGPFGLSPPSATRSNGALGRQPSPLSDGEGYINGGSPKIYEDDSRGDPMLQEDDDTGMYGDEEDFAEDDTLQDDSPRKDPGYSPGIAPPTKEPGSLIIRTEELMAELSDLISPPPFNDQFDDDDDMDMDRPGPPSPEHQQEFLCKASKTFLATLQNHLPKSSKTKADSHLKSAYYIVSLILPLHHSTANTTEVLRKWLFTHHADPSRSQLTAVRATHPNSVFSLDFWDVVYRLTLRGEVQEAAEVLRSANWDLLADGAPPVTKPAFGAHKKINDKRYTRAEVDSIKEAVATAIWLLNMCPGKGRSSYQPPLQFFPAINPVVDSPGSPADWRIWRGQVLKASEELKGISQAEIDLYNEDSEDSYYDTYYPIGGRGGSFGFTHASKSKTTKVPSEVLRGLRSLYDVMQGEVDAILSSAEIWQEAVVGLMMWTKDVDSAAADEEDRFEDNVDVKNMGPGEYFAVLLHRKRRQLEQLSSALEMIADEMPLNPTESLEIAAGGAMAGDPMFIVEMGKYSQLVTAAVVEIGGWGGWVKRETTFQDPLSGKSMGLDEDDFALLETVVDDTDQQASSAENSLRRYASSLFGTKWIDEGAEIEGWELGVGLLSRVKNGKALAGKLLTEIPLTIMPRVEKLLKYAAESRLPHAASTIAYTWAKHLQSSAQDNYGDILHFLSLSAPINAAARKTLHDTVTTLLQRSLLSSRPFPDPANLDPRLKHLLSSPSECKSEILRFELSGYAALRTFYALRTSAPETAAKALTAVVRAAGEPIDGGVWDRDWESPVEPTALPAVLRELLTCVRALSTRDALDIAKVVTDWEGCGEALKKKSVETREGWVDVGRADVERVMRGVREALCKVLAVRWLS